MKQLKYTLAELPQIAEEILEKASCKTLLFYGKMGVGKTTLIKELAKKLGSSDVVSSPTFSLVNEYSTPTQPIFHFDFYRIEDETEALDMGIEEYFAQDTWLFIEWPEKIAHFLPEEVQEIHIKREGAYNFLQY